jgi:hypothetical protein
MAMNFATATFILGVIAKYLHNHIEPEVNQILRTEPRHEVLHWESFLSRERANLFVLFLENVGPIASMLVVLLPGAASLVVAHYVSLLPQTKGAQQGAVLSFEPSLLLLLSVVAWCIYLLAIASLIMVTIYQASKPGRIRS